VKVLLVGVALNRMGQFVQIFLMIYLTGIGIPTVNAGAVLTAFGAGSIVGVFTGGALADRIGPRWTIALSMFVSGGFIGSLAVVQQYALLFPICAITGVATQVYRPACASLVADFTPASRLVIASAAYRFGLNIGASVGPLVGALLITQSFAAVFLTNACTCLIFGVVTLLWIPDARRPRERQARVQGRYLDLARDRAFVLVLAAQFLTSLAEVQYLTLLPLEIRDRALPEQLYGGLVALNGLLVIALELPLTRYVQRMPIRTAMAAGSGLIGLGLAAFGLPVGPWILVVGTVVWTSGEIVSAPSAVAYPALAAPSGLRGRYIGAMTAAQTTGYAVGPSLGAALYQPHTATAWLLCAGLGVGAAAGMTIGVLNPRELTAAGGTTRNPD
jgi:MFS family permease